MESIKKSNSPRITVKVQGLDSSNDLESVSSDEEIAIDSINGQSNNLTMESNLIKAIGNLPRSSQNLIEKTINSEKKKAAKMRSQSIMPEQKIVRELRKNQTVAFLKPPNSDDEEEKNQKDEECMDHLHGDNLKVDDGHRLDSSQELELEIIKREM